MQGIKEQISNVTEWIEVGELGDIPRQGARVVNTPQGSIAVFRTLDDEVFALRDRCPHKGGPLSQGMVYGKRVACPLHDWRIELETGVAVAPDVGCTTTYPVKLEAGKVLVRLTES
ncbi:MAG: nitrite reductase [Gammaproteobacteria bacterium RBG_16_57_12]|nr:MAG: nitrite reductase [Gammaproteobacteria bacterium RBG_16_57_12]